jgi:hypothetical protein
MPHRTSRLQDVTTTVAGICLRPEALAMFVVRVLTIRQFCSLRVRRFRFSL